MRSRLVIAMCLGQIGNLLPHVVVPAVMTVHLMPLWGLSNAQAGLMAAAYAAGYMLAVPVLSSLTDRRDARVILLWGSLFSALATFAFGAFAQGLWSALVLWALAGWLVGVALDAWGGANEPQAWTAAFTVLALGVALGPLALRWSRRENSSER